MKNSLHPSAAYRVRLNQPLLPDRQRLNRYLDTVYQSGFLTNGGPLLHQLETRLSEFLGVEHIVAVSSGTVALQLLLQCYKVQRPIISPYTFVATASASAWCGGHPVFEDIDPQTLNLSAAFLEAHKPVGDAILATHLYGNPCDIDGLEAYARTHRLPLLFDAAHTFGASLRQRALVDFGDASILSTHATKAFHTIEGGMVCVHDQGLAQEVRERVNFGLQAGAVHFVGTNAKLSELHAAAGLCLLDDWSAIREERERLNTLYDTLLGNIVAEPLWTPELQRNYAYRVAIFTSAEQAVAVQQALEQIGVETRRYFYPTLDCSPQYAVDSAVEVSLAARMASRTLCLPLYPGLADVDVQKIAEQILDVIESGA